MSQRASSGIRSMPMYTMAASWVLPRHRWLQLVIILICTISCQAWETNLYPDTRRTLFKTMLETTSLALLLPPPAGAAPMQVQETQTIGSQLLRKFRPAPPKILRGKLDLSFAVLLMRSSYQATGTYAETETTLHLYFYL